MKYVLLFREQASQQLLRLDEPYYSAIREGVIALQFNYFPEGKKCKRLQGEIRDLFRLRVGQYRILYHVDHQKKILTVLRIFHRNEGY